MNYTILLGTGLFTYGRWIIRENDAVNENDQLCFVKDNLFSDNQEIIEVSLNVRWMV